jgi:hypothetical protein
MRSIGAAVHHDAGLLLERHPPDEVVDATGGAEAPVFVGVELAVPVEVAELQPVDRDRRHAPRA